MRSVSLTCIAGPLRGKVFQLDGGPIAIFGRYAKATFNLAEDPAASHLHFLLDTSENRIRIIDLGSTNGIIINEKHYGGKVGTPFNDFIPLNPGDTILAGTCLFRLGVKTVDTPGPMERGIGVVDDEVPGATANNNVTSVLTRNPRPAQKIEPPPAERTEYVSQELDTTSPTFQGTLPTIEGYTILQKIGGGGKGVVYKAIKDDSGVAAAIKMMLFNRNKSKKQRSLEMFRREIQITKQLQHPHIVRYIGDGISTGAPYLAIEYVDGGSLDQLIHTAPGDRLELPMAIPLFIQLLEAVAYMHEQSLVHRDIKPKNVLLDLRRGGGLAVKLSDMGLSCRFTNDDSDDFLPIVSEGGTPAYMPPEQLTDLTRALPQSDVFSAGATLYQMLTGSLLYDFTDRDQNETIIAGDITPILHLRPDLPRPLADVVSKSLAYNPNDRYANAQEMLDALRTARQHGDD